MRLADIAGTTKRIDIDRLDRDRPLCKEIQNRLSELGCLDPPADGEFGGVSRLTISMFARRLKLPYDGEITGPIAAALLEQTPASFLPVRPGKDFAGRIFTYMARNEQFFARLPGFLTIVYVEGANADGRPNRDLDDKWNDRRLVLRRDADGVPRIVHAAQATSEPGRAATIDPKRPPAGVARIAFGQFKAWQVGTHHPDLSPPRRHEALTQARSVTVFRDKDKNGRRTGDKAFTGRFGINQHSGLDHPTGTVGKASAGCLVARRDADHKAFMKLVKTDPRYARATRAYVFMTSVIDGDDLMKQVPVA